MADGCKGCCLAGCLQLDVSGSHWGLLAHHADVFDVLALPLYALLHVWVLQRLQTACAGHAHA